jgi:hypothetical protein
MAAAPAPHMSKVEQESNPVEELNYYHLTLSNIPLAMPVPEIADLIQVQPDAEEIKAIKDECGYEVIPHQLHVFKETLPTKFAMFTYYMKPVAITTKTEGEVVDEGVISRRDQAHAYFTQYMKRTSQTRVNDGATVDSGNGDGVKTVAVEYDGKDAPSETANEATKEQEEAATPSHIITLAQPEYVRNCLPFFQEVSAAQCAFFDTALTPDPKKLRTYVLSKVHFFTKEEVDKRAAKMVADGREGPTPIGVLRASDISPKEWVWLRSQHKGFPQKATSDLITAFFVKHLHPLFVYHDTVTA